MCIINNSKKFIFIHVPKSAGTSVSSYYSHISTCRDVEVGGTIFGEILQPYYQKRFGVSKHSTFDEVATALGEGVIECFFTFGFVRNPYDRVVSFFTFLRKWDGWSGHDEFLKITNVNEFIQSDFFFGDGIDRQFMPQAFWLGGNPEKHTNKVAYIGRVEDMEGSIKFINNKIGYSDDSKKLEVKNKSKDFSQSPEVTLDLTRASIDIINEKYKIDFKLYGYAVL